MKYRIVADKKRKELLDYFQHSLNPFGTLSYEIDITNFYKNVKNKQLKFYSSFLFVILTSCNSIKEFRYRIKEQKIIEYLNIGISYTSLENETDLCFNTVEWTENFGKFYESAMKLKSEKRTRNIVARNEREDVVIASGAPFITFTAYQPIIKNKNFAVPQIIWGKFYKNCPNKIQLPISITTHHGLVDGVHIGNLNEEIQKRMAFF